MAKRQYKLDNDDKRLIDDALHIVAGGSLRMLSRLIERSEPFLRHVLAGRAKGLDPATRDRLQHLIVLEQAKDLLVEGADATWDTRADAVMEHLLSCPTCLASALQSSARHHRQTVARRPTAK